MDLILTGRPVEAAEAQRIGLANRIVPSGTERSAAEELAAALARFPQTCLRQDRLSVLGQEGLSEGDAIAAEWRHGMVSLGTDALSGARRFAEGAGRGGSFGDFGDITGSSSESGRTDVP
jgi:enoyl-CoA hydratase